MRHKVSIVLVTLAAVLTMVLATATVVFAHAEVVGSSPSSGSTVGGDIERIDIVFADLVANAVVSVTGPDGLVAGQMVQAEGQVIAFGLEDKLETEGQYKVEFEFDSIDDADFVELEFAFNYEKGAAEPLPVVAGAGTPDSNTSRIAIGMLGVSTVGLAVLLLWRYRKLAVARAQAEARSS